MKHEKSKRADAISTIEHLKEDVEKIQQEITVLQGYFDAWWLLKGAPTRGKYLSVLRQYNEFFLFSEGAFFAAFIVAAFKIWDKRRNGDVLTILKLVNKTEKTPNFWKNAEIKLDSIKKKCAEGEMLWRKVGILRNEYFAHLGVSGSHYEVFRKADVTPDELRNLVEISKDVVNLVSYQIDRSTHRFNITPKGDGERLLETLLDQVCRGQQHP